MINPTSLKFFASILIMALLMVTASGVYESAHAMKNLVSTASDQVTQPEVSDSNQCPTCPPDHKDCHVCINCVCHSFLTIQPFQFSYTPPVLDLVTPERFKFLPEVYLSKFIPPQIHA